MSRTPTIAAIVALGLGVAGCSTTPPPTNGLQARNNPSFYSVHQPVVQRTDFVFDVATNGEGVSPAELARLDAWFASIDLRYGDTVSVDEPRGYESPAARADIAGVAARYGLLLGDGAPVTNGTVQPGSARVIASRATASVPDCPDWNGADISPVNNTSSNYGCATNSNLAAMVANPNDLIQGQDGSVNRNAATATRAIRTYREVPPTGRQGLSAPTTTGQNQ